MSNPVIKISLGQFLELSAVRRDCEQGLIDEECLTERMHSILGDEICDAVYANQERGLVTKFTVKSPNEYTEDEFDDYGYAGLVEIGFTPQQARDRIVARHANTPGIAAFYRQMQETEEGRKFLDLNAAEWRKSGVEPPWLELLHPPDELK